MQKEGFCLMWYKCEKCRKKERLWNSRNRVTPFMIGCSDCDGTMQHENFNLDLYAPEHQPKTGDRVFIDMPKELAEIKYMKQVDAHWESGEYPISGMFESKKEALKSFREQWQFGSPMVETV